MIASYPWVQVLLGSQLFPLLSPVLVTLLPPPPQPWLSPIIAVQRTATAITLNIVLSRFIATKEEEYFRSYLDN